ncbi:MAG: hypothetical protein PHQ53_04575 [Candidatus Krumholzibacteria bacterium]|nr:hypothetical protein [Candidatus Krumholzibacteria bacterium]
MTTNMIACDLLARAVVRLPFDERATAAEILRELVKLEAAGAVASRHVALRRLARLAPEPLRRELYSQVGLRLASGEGVAS